MKQAELVIIAGVNGAGKTTFYQQNQQRFEQFTYISADEFLRKMHGNWRKSDDQIKAMLQADAAIRKLIDQHINIVYEVNLGGNARSLVKIMDLAHSMQYSVTVIEIKIRDAALAVERILQRFKAGGFGADPALMTKRFINLESDFVELEQAADQVIKFDNTQSFVRCD